MIYRKWGRVVRWENGTLVRVEEAGEAREENGVFVAQPIAHSVILSREDGEGSRARVASIVEEILRCAQDDVAVERAIVIDGIAVHEYDGKRWDETTRRVHVALTRRPWRVLVDDAGVAPVADALARCEGEKEFEHVLLAAPLARRFVEDRHSCLSPWPAGTGKSACPPPNFEQLPGGVDGYGRPIERRRVEGEAPNFYRPSYRVRPVRHWFNVRALPFGTMQPAPLVLALVDGGKALVADERGRVFVTRLRVDRVTAAAESGAMLL